MGQCSAQPEGAFDDDDLDLKQPQTSGFEVALKADVHRVEEAYEDELVVVNLKVCGDSHEAKLFRDESAAELHDTVLRELKSAGLKFSQ